MIEEVAALLRQAAQEAIVPRFGCLQQTDIREKTPGDPVTIADGHAEQIITAGLLELLPASRVVGEEACAASPELLAGLDEGKVWLVDPLDGTLNFSQGKEPFRSMVALLDGGETVASWILDPMSGRLCAAELGSGAFVDGTRLRIDGALPSEPLRGSAISPSMPAPVRDAVESRAAGLTAIAGMHCAGAEYPAIACGDRHFTIFWRTWPWDHAPGTLFLEEAGGHVARPDGGRYYPNSEEFGLIVARSPAIGEQLRERLFA